VFGASAVNLLDVGVDAVPVPISFVACAEPRRIDGIHVDVFAPILMFLEADDKLFEGMTETSKKIDEVRNRIIVDLGIGEAEVESMEIKWHSTKNY